jgi:MoxR-like ATPase
MRMPPNSTSVPVHEEAVVSCIIASIREVESLKDDIAVLHAELAGTQQALALSEDRARRVEFRSDIIAEAFEVVRKRPRHE